VAVGWGSGVVVDSILGYKQRRQVSNEIIHRTVYDFEAIYGSVDVDLQCEVIGDWSIITNIQMLSHLKIM
jgi:hypothetical protein